MAYKNEQSNPVLRAVMLRDATALSAALRAGMAVDVRDRDGRTPLHQAAIFGDVAIAEALIAAGAELAAADTQGWTPLHFAAQSWQVDVARILIVRGAPVDPVDEQGNTPLWRAAFASRGRGELIDLLLASGADRNRKNIHGTSPLDLARTIANFDVLQWFKG
jgi:ankyrin repeat protein